MSARPPARRPSIPHPSLPVMALACWLTGLTLALPTTAHAQIVIDLDGVVGPIGGVQQKVLGAEWDGAEYFLSPAENYKDAQAAAHRIKVVKVETAEQAIQFGDAMTGSQIFCF